MARGPAAAGCTGLGTRRTRPPAAAALLPWASSLTFQRGADVIAQDFSRLLQAHRSIRHYQSRPLDGALIDRVLAEAWAGSSSSGNLNMVSVVKTADPARKARLHALHFEQPMVLQAPLVLTFCADSFRTRQWLAQREARVGFGDFISWHVAAFDAIILAQTTALALESHGLGICYMGTTLHSMREIADFLELPDHCLPVTSMVVGWPAEAPAQRDRLPPAAWIHDERYRRPTAADIDTHFTERERRGRERYLAMGPEMVAAWQAHGITSLAQYYTSKMKYDPDQFAVDAAALQALLRERGFLG
ncbi:MAG: oxidoreductase [Leptothrix sp. (in: Bacteria)]|nr:oxidoreductase [Leptothrix sp. (in: b-proteobacteria)]